MSSPRNERQMTPEIVAPDLVDSHCHLDFADFDGEVPALIARAQAAGVTRMVTICTRLRNEPKVRAIAEAYPPVFYAAGTHPMSAADEPMATVAELVALAAHPKVDAKRVALMGFSHGGIVTMLASTTWAKENFAPAGQPSFRAFFPFYPYCNTIFPERDRVSAPVRIHTGAADDWTPAKPCADLAGSLKAAGQDVSISVYPDAYHSFAEARDTVFLPNVVNPADCFAKMPSILGPLAPESIANCVKKGATVGNSPSATEQARKNLRTQLEELLR